MHGLCLPQIPRHRLDKHVKGKNEIDNPCPRRASSLSGRAAPRNAALTFSADPLIPPGFRAEAEKFPAAIPSIPGSIPSPFLRNPGPMLAGSPPKGSAESTIEMALVTEPKPEGDLGNRILGLLQQLYCVRHADLI